jgi:hypothetical protein
MQGTTAILGSTIFFIIAPCVAVGLIPFWITRWQFQPPLFGLELTRLLGGAFILAGIPGIAKRASESTARYPIGRRACRSVLPRERFSPLAHGDLPQEFMSAMPRKADKPEPT